MTTDQFAMTAVCVYMIFGIGKWASHVLTCPGCRNQLGDVVLFALEGVRQTCAWPLYAYREFVASPPRPIPIFESPLPPGARMMEVKLEQKPGESDAEYQVRIRETIRQLSKEVQDERERNADGP